MVNAHSGNPGHEIIVLTAGTGIPRTADQDGIALHYTNGGDPGIGLHVRAKDGAAISQIVGSKIIVGIDEKVFIRLARTSETTATFEIFSDAARTLHVVGVGWQAASSSVNWV